MIRLARRDDLPRLREIERSAGQAFRTIGVDAIADDRPPTLRELGTYQRAGRAWVATDQADRPVAYILVRPVDDGAHVEQVSVHADHARRGIGAKLIDTVARWAATQGLEAVTLTTFADVPWNAARYRRMRFSEVPDDEIGEGLRRIVEEEADTVPGSWPRVVMRRAAAGRAR